MGPTVLAHLDFAVSSTTMTGSSSSLEVASYSNAYIGFEVAGGRVESIDLLQHTGGFLGRVCYFFHLLINLLFGYVFVYNCIGAGGLFGLLG